MLLSRQLERGVYVNYDILIFLFVESHQVAGCTFLETGVQVCVFSFFRKSEEEVVPAGSILQNNLHKVENFTSDNLMRINEKKSKVMLFNNSKKYDFPPEFSFKDGEILECLEETKLLGILLNSSLLWDSNTANICTKTMSKIWLLRRMKTLKLESEIIFDYYS